MEYGEWLMNWVRNSDPTANSMDDLNVDILARPHADELRPSFVLSSCSDEMKDQDESWRHASLKMWRFLLAALASSSSDSNLHLPRTLPEH